MKIPVVALLIEDKGGFKTLLEPLSLESEIEVFEKYLAEAGIASYQQFWKHRQEQHKRDMAFGDYVEALVMKPFQKPDVLKHAKQWMNSKAKVERFQSHEANATRVIAEYAFKIYSENPDCQEFYLTSENARVLIRVFELPNEEALDIDDSIAS